MGLRIPYIEFIEKCVYETIGEFENKSMLELGNQVVRGGERPRIPARTSKEFYQNLGVSHSSIDLNGKHGALRLDLSKSIDKKDWLNRFDIVTNLGTSEHVEPQSGQYECFKNIHNFLTIGGIVVHIVPDRETCVWSKSGRNHANNYYKRSFFDMLTCSGAVYKLISLRTQNCLFFACLQKVSDSFVQKEIFDKHLIRESGGKIYKRINDVQLDERERKQKT